MLVPVHPVPAVATPVSAVHISELRDPTPYLDGGELLLTTGLTLPRRPAGCQEYVGRLRERGVAGLALGLGPALDTVPTVLVKACRAHQVPLFVVPDKVPFLHVTRGYWRAVGHHNELSLTTALDAHRHLVTAAVSSSPTIGVLRAVAEEVGGWAALTDPTGDAHAVWPPDRIDSVAHLVEEIARLRGAGVRAAATFPLGSDVAVLHPVRDRRAVVAYLAVVSDHPLRPADRGVVVAALALLGLEVSRRTQLDAVDAARRAAVAELIDAGHLEPARGLAEVFALEFPPSRVRLVVASGDEHTLAALVEALPEHARRWIGVGSPTGAWLLLHPGLPVPTAARLAAGPRVTMPQAQVRVGPSVRLSEVRATRVRLEAALCETDAADADPTRAGEWSRHLVAPLTGCYRPELVPTVVAYLRCRGSWEATARQLGVHRNTVRARVTAAERLLARSLDDPDTAARLWLALRADGHA